MLFCCLQLFGALAANAAVDPGKHSLAEVQATIRESERLDAEGNFGQAAVLRERACSGFAHGRGERSEDYADCINQLGGLYLKQGDYERALPLIERAIDVFEERADAGFRLGINQVRNATSDWCGMDDETQPWSSPATTKTPPLGELP